MGSGTDTSTPTCWCVCYGGARAATPDLPGGARNLLGQLARIRQCRIVEHTGRAGRPRIRQQMEEIEASLENLGRALNAFPPLTGGSVVYTERLP
jgi:hypothetical protein